MLRLRDYFPFLKGWSYDTFVKRNVDVTRKVKTILRRREKGWLVSIIMMASNKYVTLEVKTDQFSLTLNPETLYNLRIVSTLKPSHLPFTVRYSEETAGSETGYFAVALDDADWVPYSGTLEIRAQIPEKVILPDYTTVTPTATSAKIYFLQVVRVRIVSERDFFTSLQKLLATMAIGREPRAEEIEKIKAKLLG